VCVCVWVCACGQVDHMNEAEVSRVRRESSIVSHYQSRTVSEGEVGLIDSLYLHLSVPCLHLDTLYLHLRGLYVHFRALNALLKHTARILGLILIHTTHTPYTHTHTLHMRQTRLALTLN
jgi:hypothetical protein